MSINIIDQLAATVAIDTQSFIEEAYKKVELHFTLVPLLCC